MSSEAAAVVGGEAAQAVDNIFEEALVAVVSGRATAVVGGEAAQILHAKQ